MKIELEKVIKIIAAHDFKSSENYIKTCEELIRNHLFKINELETPFMQYMILEDAIDAFTQIKDALGKELAKRMGETRENAH